MYKMICHKSHTKKETLFYKDSYETLSMSNGKMWTVVQKNSHFIWPAVTWNERLLKMLVKKGHINFLSFFPINNVKLMITAIFVLLNFIILNTQSLPFHLGGKLIAWHLNHLTTGLCLEHLFYCQRAYQNLICKSINLIVENILFLTGSMR